MTEDIEAHVARVVDKWPRFTAEQLERLSFLLQPALTNTTSNGNGSGPPGPDPFLTNTDTTASRQTAGVRYEQIT